MNIKGIVIRVGVVLVIALSLPIVAQNWETGAMKAEREAQEEAKRKQEEETARREAAAKASISTSTVTDPRDGQKYRTVKIGGNTWMAENLNYAIDGSGCYNNDASNCKKYGRLYVWDAAKDACRGMGGKWRLPTLGDWDNLANFAEDKNVAGKKLKAKSGWSGDGNGTDDYGFSALPGGNRDFFDGSFSYAGNSGGWWSATESVGGRAYGRRMGYYDSVIEYAYDVRYGLSARCVED